jgi:hypothetical protein
MHRSLSNKVSKVATMFLKLCLLLIAVFAHVASAKSQAPLSDRLLRLCKGKPAIEPRSRRSTILRWLIDASGESSLLLASSPQNAAACWILYADKRAPKKKPALLQRYSLATLHYSTATPSNEWDWHMANDVAGAAAAKGNWMNTNMHECAWYGVACNARKQITSLNLGFLALDGLLPRELGLLTNLNELDVHGCDLQGVLPHKMLAGLSQLEYLRLHMNGFFGAIHGAITGLKNLKQLVLFGNYIGALRC